MAKDFSNWTPKQDVAKLFGITERQVERLAKEQKIRRDYRSIPGRRPLPVFHPTDIEDLRQQVIPATPDDNGTPKKLATLPIPRNRSTASIIAALAAVNNTNVPFQHKLFLSLKEARYERLFENANDGIVILSRDGRFVAVNQKFAELTGMPREEIIGKTTEIFLPGGSAQSLERIKRTIKEDKLGPYELEVTTPLGKKVFSLNALAYFEGETRVGVMYIVRDITERKRTEEALQQSEQNYRRLVNNIHDGIFVIQDGKMQFVNETFATMVGCAVEEVIDMGFQDLVAPEDLEMVTERYRRRQAGEDVPGEYEFRMLHKDKVTRVVVELNVGLMTYRGRVASMGTVKDITVKKEFEQQRADLLAMLTHDIKNPLGAILGYTEVLLKEAEEVGLDEGKKLLQGLKSNAFTILSLVNNYLDLSKIEAGRLTPVKEPLGLNEVVSRVGQQYEGEAQRRHITLEVRLGEELPLVEGDPMALERVFANLVNNALKFTPRLGGVTLSSAQQNNEVVVAVADTGPGIEPEEVPTLFERYKQGATGQLQQGVGLGLFIVKSLVEAHGGRIEVESTVGQGSCFSVFLPLLGSQAIHHQSSMIT